MSASGMCGANCVARRIQTIGDDLIEIWPAAAAFAAKLLKSPAKQETPPTKCA